MKKISKTEAAKKLNIAPMTLALLLQQGKLTEIGIAYKNKNGRYSYIIWEDKLNNFLNKN